VTEPEPSPLADEIATRLEAMMSAHVMVDWDIPWSLVRLEQRAGRLHRIGQENAVFIYHLVAPATREGRVQEVLLTNLDAAAQALEGRIFDLMDATAARAGFDYAAALADAYRGIDSIERVPSTEALVAQAQQLAAEEDELRTPTDLSEAQARFAADRLEAINPVMVEGFLRSIAGASGWGIGPGPAERILTYRAVGSRAPRVSTSWHQNGTTTSRHSIRRPTARRLRAGFDARSRWPVPRSRGAWSRLEGNQGSHLSLDRHSGDLRCRARSPEDGIGGQRLDVGQER
jgi:hypothetical protein